MPADPFVTLSCPPHSGYLRLWGRNAAGWYGLIRWDEPTVDFRTGTGHRGVLFCTGWVPAALISPWDDHTGYAQVQRVNLGGNPHTWPTLLRNATATHPDDFYLGLLDGSQIEPPPGVVWLGQPPR